MMGLEMHMHAYSVDHDQVEQRAYRLWEQRGRPLESPERDWCQARWQVVHEARSPITAGTGEELHVHTGPHPGHAEIAHRAYQLWEARGSPWGSPDEDWFRAECELDAEATPGGPAPRPMALFAMRMGPDTTARPTEG
jgi:hypothetical protein